MKIKRFVLMVLMISASLVAALLVPRNFLAELNINTDFEKLTPEIFSEWKKVDDEVGVVIDPVQKSELDRFYSQTVSRVYANKAGYRVMLSIAYGKAQTDSLRVHSPEICYPAQGFMILSSKTKTVEFPGGRGIPLTFSVAKSIERVEPLTYLVLVGARASAAGVDRKLAQLEYGLQGVIPDGVILRVSSIDSNTDRAEARQLDFLTSLYRSMALDSRAKLFGLR
ncbi:MAG: EpsI family protein [Rhodocyclaceae bacterium]|nr:MAG: EpsI family protein [Rhodocyclaceae bacterium]